MVKNVIQVKSGITISECKTPSKHVCENIIFGIQVNGKHLESIINDSVIKCDEIVEALRSESTKIMPMNFNDKKATRKISNLYILS